MTYIESEQHSRSLSWTPTALECYFSNGCNSCSIPKDIKKRCKMRLTVDKIVDKYGAPDELIRKDYIMRDLKQEEIAKYRERLQPYIDEVMAKYDRKERRQAIYDKCMEKLKDMKG